ncbi:MAG: hypothetical protein M1816_001770 [Peltula sp. TS41687]|nr:MAG: hypothetical protein M1816_001770 [Peltula sp. TS41687]
MGKEDYATAGGSLKLKGVKDSKVDKKKKKKKAKSDVVEETEKKQAAASNNKHEGKKEDKDPSAEAEEQEAIMPEDLASSVGKTEAERKHEEMRRQRLAERLRREGIKTHKERVEELNKYLSNLSEHHDMPRIGPG